MCASRFEKQQAFKILALKNLMPYKNTDTDASIKLYYEFLSPSKNATWKEISCVFFLLSSHWDIASDWPVKGPTTLSGGLLNGRDLTFHFWFHSPTRESGIIRECSSWFLSPHLSHVFHHDMISQIQTFFRLYYVDAQS